MKDNFSEQSLAYSKFRPGYPDAMVQTIVSHCAHREAALDIATGNGQLASKLAAFFDEVTATDISEKQLEKAIRHDNIRYEKRPAEDLGMPDHSFDLIAVAQAVHWFDFRKFYPEVYRLLKPDGIFAILGYGHFRTNPKADAILHHLYTDILGAYWDPERAYVDQGYATIPFPLDEIPVEAPLAEYEWTFGQLTGYLDSWSAVSHYKKKVGIDPIDLIRHELALVWELGDRKVYFPMLLRIGRPYKAA